MTKDEAQSELERLAGDDPDSTFKLYQAEPGDWAVARIALRPPSQPDGANVEARPRPDADDPRPAAFRQLPPFGPG
ncbi:MAG: hypothetical protein EXQ70_10075 [Solirubrobacterales bacterium]|nr:hypothetical protein [Solirubrobacterales bacterium]